MGRSLWAKIVGKSDTAGRTFQREMSCGATDLPVRPPVPSPPVTRLGPGRLSRGSTVGNGIKITIVRQKMSQNLPLFSHSVLPLCIKQRFNVPVQRINVLVQRFNVPVHLFLKFFLELFKRLIENLNSLGQCPVFHIRSPILLYNL